MAERNMVTLIGNIDLINAMAKTPEQKNLSRSPKVRLLRETESSGRTPCRGERTEGLSIFDMLVDMARKRVMTSNQKNYTPGLSKPHNKENTKKR